MVSESLGERFALAVAAKDSASLMSILRPEIDFRGMTTAKVWEASTAAEVIDRVLASWFDDNDHVDEVLSVDSGRVGDRDRVVYRFAVHNNDGQFVVEHHAFYKVEDGAISWIRVLCSGYQPVGPTDADRIETHP